MKTLELELKKKVFIIDTTAPIEAIEIEDYEFLCKGSELTEEIASELVDKSSFVVDRWYHLAKRGFKANVESQGFYWLENPYDKSINVNSDISNSMVRMVNRINYKEQWQEAEEKTFRNPLIFVKK